MTEDKGILIQNIYYMLSYAFQVLKQENYREIAGEPFENIQDLFACILAKGIAQYQREVLVK
jgi:5-methylcytosine-specific restriction enzyme subunit McrC